MSFPNRQGTPSSPVSPIRLELDLQNASVSDLVPAHADIVAWASAALNGWREMAELTVRVVDLDESAGLNLRYRGRPGPTNVLSFPFSAPPGSPETTLLGDLVVCAPVVEREAGEQGKPLNAHWAHMIVHGVLHLLGFDHADDDEAAVMEGLETDILRMLGFPQPY